MARVTLNLPANWYSQFTSGAGNSQIIYGDSSKPRTLEIPTALMAGSTRGYFEGIVLYYVGSLRGFLSLNISVASPTFTGSVGPDLSTAWETNGFIQLTASDGTSFTVPSTDITDRSESYLIDVTDEDGLVAFANHIRSLTDKSATLVLDDGAAVAPSWNDNTGDAITGLAGTAIIPITVPAVDAGTPAPVYAASGLPAGLAFNTSTRVISGTPSAAGRGTITITATNSAGRSARTHDYAFTNPNLAPTVLIATHAQAVEGGASIALRIAASDRDGNIVSYAWALVGVGSLSANNVAQPTWTAPAATDAEQTATLTITVTDDDGATDEASVTFTVLPRLQFALGGALIRGNTHDLAIGGVLLGGLAFGDTLLYERT